MNTVGSLDFSKNPWYNETNNLWLLISSQSNKLCEILWMAFDFVTTQKCGNVQRDSYPYLFIEKVVNIYFFEKGGGRTETF